MTLAPISLHSPKSTEALHREAACRSVRDVRDWVATRVRIPDGEAALLWKALDLALVDLLKVHGFRKLTWFERDDGPTVRMVEAAAEWFASENRGPGSCRLWCELLDLPYEELIGKLEPFHFIRRQRAAAA